MKIRTKFNWLQVRRNVKKMMRRKYKKTIKLSDVDRIWLDYVEYAIVEPLLKHGIVQVDNNITIELVGKRVENHLLSRNLAAKGKYVKGSYVGNIEKVNYKRLGIIYSVRFTDKSHKGGKLVFETDAKLKKRISEHLFNSFQPYRIAG